MTVNWRCVILESPFAGKGKSVGRVYLDAALNKRYLDKCIGHCVERGDSPYASHKMLTGALNDMVPAERARGIHAGFAWGGYAAAVVVYIDRGVSNGMFLGIDKAIYNGKPVEYYSIYDPQKLMLTRDALEAYRR